MVILFGEGGLRPWAQAELQASVNLAVTEKKGLIPVLLPGHPAEPELPCFVRQYPFVDMRRGVAEGIDQLEWGVTGRPPPRQAVEILPAAVAISTALVSANRAGTPAQESQEVDAIGVAAVKRKLHIASYMIAQDAALAAANAAKAYPSDVLTMFVPLVVDLRWRRGYAAGLKRLLKVPQGSKRIGDFACEEPDRPCMVDSGLLSAVLDDSGHVEIRLQDQLAAVVTGLKEEEAAAISDSVNRYGRLGTSPGTSMSVIERIKAIEVSLGPSGKSDRLADDLFRQREVLIPLLARRGIPSEIELLEQEDVYPTATESLPIGSSEGWKPLAPPNIGSEAEEAEEIEAHNAWTPRLREQSAIPEALRRMLDELRRRRRNS